MDYRKKEAIIEAVLFTMGESVSVAKLSIAIEEDENTTKNIIHGMMEKYQTQDRGIIIIELEDAFQLCTKTEMYEYLIKVAKTPKKNTLTDSVLETLSIVAYKQPITRLEIEKIRGVSCDHAVNKLIDLDLIQELGRLDAPGRPLLFGTTEQFLRCFGVKSITDLPELAAEQIEDFKEQAEEEIQMKLDV